MPFPTTTVEIMGGLGNQLFQIFALLAYSLKHKTAFYFSSDPIQHGQRKQTYWHTTLLKTLRPFVKQNKDTSRMMISYEQGFHYQPLPLPDLYHNTLKFFGYLQSYKYFAEQQENIFRLLKLSETQSTIKEKTAHHYPYEKNMLAIHFRVGDYVQLPNHHPLMPLKYYSEALEQFLQQAEQQEALAGQQTQTQAPQPILYFCEKNDQPYVETQFIQPLQAQFKDKFTFQCIDHILADWEQVIVMSLCKHHIIANSTFSWWGAYLRGASEAAPHTVYYPSTWFGPAVGYKNMADLFPPHWQKINI